MRQHKRRGEGIPRMKGKQGPEVHLRSKVDRLSIQYSQAQWQTLSSKGWGPGESQRTGERQKTKLNKQRKLTRRGEGGETRKEIRKTNNLAAISKIYILLTYTNSILRGWGKKKCRNEPNPYPSRAEKQIRQYKKAGKKDRWGRVGRENEKGREYYLEIQELKATASRREQDRRARTQSKWLFFKTLCTVRRRNFRQAMLSQEINTCLRIKQQWMLYYHRALCFLLTMMLTTYALTHLCTNWKCFIFP